MSDPGGAVDPDAFAGVVEEIAAGVSVVSTTSRGLQHAITATSYTWASREPPLLLVCVHEDARFLDAVDASGTWGLSLLNAAQRSTAAWLATPGRPAVGQLDRVPHAAGAVTGVPLLDGALATFECRTTAVHEAGDHAVVVGLVVAMTVGPGGSPEGPGAPRDPLVRFRGNYRRLA